MTTRAMSVRVLPRQGGGQAATGQQRQENNAYSTGTVLMKGTRGVKYEGFFWFWATFLL